VAFAGLLPHVATVMRRRTVNGEQTLDRFGQPTRNEEAYDTYRCRVTTGSGGEQLGERTRDVAVTTHKVFFQLGANIREDDIISISGHEGNLLIKDAIITRITEPYGMRHRHHVEVEIQTQRGVKSVP